MVNQRERREIVSKMIKQVVCVCVYYVGVRVVVQPVSGQHDDVTLDLKKKSTRKEWWI